MSFSSASLAPHVDTHEATPSLGPEQRRLDVFVGRWTVEGKTAAVAAAPSEIMTQQHTYEWLPGGFHLLHRWDGRIGQRDSKGIEIIGYNAGTDTYEAHFFDSDGWARVYVVCVRDRLWTCSGVRERSTIMVSEDGKTMTTHWDRALDGVTWEPLCDVTAKRD